MAYVKSQHYAAWRQIAQCSWARLEAKHEELACSTHDHRLICYLMLTDPSAVHTQRKSLMSHSISNRSVWGRVFPANHLAMVCFSTSHSNCLFLLSYVLYFIFTSCTLVRFVVYLINKYCIVGAFCHLLNKRTLYCTDEANLQHQI